MQLMRISKAVEIPENALVVMVGPAGSGKSTFAKNAFGDAVVASDLCRYMVADTMEDMSVNDQAFHLYHTWIEQRLILGKLTVADATHVKDFARKKLLDLAAKYDRPTVALIIDAELERTHKWNLSRERQVPDFIVEKHTKEYEEALKVIETEGFSHVYLVDPMNPPKIHLGKVPAMVHAAAPGWDVIGDIHGCFDEFMNLTAKLGYLWTSGNVLVHPRGRRLVFVGDFTDRGPKSVDVLRMVRRLVEDGDALAVMGNHDNKLWRTLKGNPTKMAHGLQGTMKQFEERRVDEQEREELKLFLGSLPYQLRLGVMQPDVGDLIVAHAGLRYDDIGSDAKAVRSFCLYGQVDGFLEDGTPNRTFGWADGWQGPEWLVYGHTVVDAPLYANNTVDIDTGCVFGGYLTALRYPELEFVTVDAKEEYESRVY